LFTGVFTIHHESSKLVYYASRFYDKLDDLFIDEFAKRYRIPNIVKSGMTMSMTKAVVVGNESQEIKKKDGDNSKKKSKDGKNKFYNERVNISGDEK
jgi:hypothetical protein